MRASDFGIPELFPGQEPEFRLGHVIKQLNQLIEAEEERYPSMRGSRAKRMELIEDAMDKLREANRL